MKLILLSLEGMQKTRKAIAKKFKITASGKILRRKPGFRHFLRRKSTVQKRKAAHDIALPRGLAQQVKRALPFA
jgi:large subunit ribosomal protein L35